MRLGTRARGGANRLPRRVDPEARANTLVAGLKADPMLGCGVPPPEREQAALGLMVYADQRAALHALQTRFDRPAARILEAWNGLPAADRRTFSADLAARTDDTREHATLYRGLVMALAGKLDILNQEAVPVVSIFVRSQGLLESIGHGGTTPT